MRRIMLVTYAPLFMFSSSRKGCESSSHRTTTFGVPPTRIRQALVAGTAVVAMAPIRNLVIAIAMEAEANPFVSRLELRQDSEFFPSNVPFRAFTGSSSSREDGCNVTVVTNGKDEVYGTGVDNCGTVPAALATFLALAKLDHVDLLINAGTCGGFQRKGAQIGDVYLTTSVAHHDRRIPIPDFSLYGIGTLPSSFPHLRGLAALMEDDVKTGACSTGNSLDKTDVDMAYMTDNDACVKDMEAAAVAWVCNLYDVPFFGVKVVTDIVDGNRPTEEEFLENLGTASQSLQSALPKLIDILTTHDFETPPPNDNDSK